MQRVGVISSSIDDSPASYPLRWLRSLHPDPCFLNIILEMTVAGERPPRVLCHPRVDIR